MSKRIRVRYRFGGMSYCYMFYTEKQARVYLSNISAHSWQIDEIDPNTFPVRIIRTIG